jgi:hypothetical protein
MFDVNTRQSLGLLFPAGAGGLATPSSMAFGPDGNLYVSYGFSVNRYHPTTGNFLGTFVDTGDRTGQRYAIGIAWGPDGNLYVATQNTPGVQRYNGTTGAFMGDFVPDGSGGLTEPFHISFTTDTNQLPVARCHDVTRSADSSCQASVSAADVDNGSQGDAITFALSPAGPYLLGTNHVTLTVTDSHGASDSCTALVIVQDTTPPSLTCPNDVVVAVNDGCSAINVNLGLPATSDTCGVAGVTNNAPVRFPLGTNLVTWTATDTSGNSATCVQRVIVRNTAPQLLSLTATPNELWPPNHRMVPVMVSVKASDSCDPSPRARILSVTSNQPANPSSPDWQLTGPLSVNLRAERLGNSGDRIYTLLIEVTDSSGNKTDGTVTVTVPHDRSGK